jgi:hypothetical protein
VLGQDREVTRRPSLLLLVALALVAGCTGPTEPGADEDPPPVPGSAATSASPPEAAPDPPPAPEVGSCHRLSYRAAVSPTAPRGAAPCAAEHTAETFFVGRLDTVVDGRLLAVDSTRVERQVAEACPRRLGAWVGGTEEQRRLSMVRPVWFTPTVAASDAGAGWFRCDAVVLAGTRNLLRVDSSLRGVLDTEAGRGRLGLCATAEPGTPGFRRVVCERPHAWRAIRTVPLGGGDYPGREQVSSAGDEPCRDAGRSVADDPLDFAWGYEWPSAEQWRAGRTYGVCWVPA